MPTNIPSQLVCPFSCQEKWLIQQRCEWHVGDNSLLPAATLALGEVEEVEDMAFKAPFSPESM
jgi:hypothetical protein